MNRMRNAECGMRNEPRGVAGRACPRAGAERPYRQSAIRNPQSEIGFSLLEVLVATALLGIAVAALMQGISGSLRNLSQAQSYEKVVLVGRSQLNRLLVETLKPGRMAGQWDEDFRWEAQVRRWNPTGAAEAGTALPPLLVVRLTVFWPGAGGEKQATFETSKYEPNLPPQ